MRFRYIISVRISQAVFTQKELSIRLGMEHEQLGRGPVRTMIRGRPFWRRTMMESNSEEKYFEVALEEVLTSLEPHMGLLRKLHKAEADMELFIGLFGEGNIMHELSPYLMWKASRLRLGFCFDIYPPRKGLEEGSTAD